MEDGYSAGVVTNLQQRGRRLENLPPASKLYFIANDIEDGAKQKAIILTACGPTYGIIRNVVAPKEPVGVTLDELETVIGSHYNPKPTETVQRCLFNVRVRKSGETVTQFITELKKLAEHCKFGDDLLQIIYVTELQPKGEGSVIDTILNGGLVKHAN